MAASTRQQPWICFMSIQCVCGGLVANSMFRWWTKTSVLSGKSRPPLGNVQSIFFFIVGIGNGVFFRYGFDSKHANASWSNFLFTSNGNQVNANSSQVLGICPFLVTYAKPALINSFLARYSVVRDRHPRLLTIDHATVKLPLLSPRYCPASSSSNLQAKGLNAVNAGESNTLRTIPTNGSEYLLPLNLLRLTAYASAISGTASNCSFNCVGFLGLAFGAGGTGWPPVLSNT